jgi:hypothetical protein
MIINQERLALGLAALRSGEYLQGLGRLKRVTEGAVRYCCLGVLTEVAIANGCENIRHDQNWPQDYEQNTAACDCPECQGAGRWLQAGAGDMCKAVRDWYGFESGNPRLGHDGEFTAIGANDTLGWDFTQIAQAFEDSYMGAGDETAGTHEAGESSSPS